MIVGGSEIDDARAQRLLVLGFADLKRALLLEEVGDDALARRRQVDDDQDRRWEIGGQGGQDDAQGLDTARRDADDHSLDRRRCGLLDRMAGQADRGLGHDRSRF